MSWTPIINFFTNPDLYIGVASAVVGGYVAFLIARYQMNVARNESKEAEKSLRNELDEKIKHDYNLQKSNLLLSHKLEISKEFLDSAEYLSTDVLSLYSLYIQVREARDEYDLKKSRDIQHSSNIEIGRIIQKLSTYRVDYASLSEMLGGLEVEVNLIEYPENFNTGVISVCSYIDYLMDIISEWNYNIPKDSQMEEILQKTVNLIVAMDSTVRKKYLSLLKTLEEDTAK